MRGLSVLGAGTAGTMVVDRVRHCRARSVWQVTVGEASARRFYQPGYLFLPFGRNSLGVTAKAPVRT